MTAGILISDPVTLNATGRQPPTPQWGRPAPITSGCPPHSAQNACLWPAKRHTQRLGPVFSRVRTGLCNRRHAHNRGTRSAWTARAREADALDREGHTRTLRFCERDTAPCLSE